MKMLTKHILFIILIFSTYSCEDILIGPQPKIKGDNTYAPALNIFGILRTDSLYRQPASFCNVGVIAPTINDTNSSWIYNDALVVVEDIETGDTVRLMSAVDSLGQRQYINYNFTPKALKTYKISCYKAGFDTVYGYSTLPPAPEISDYNFSNGNFELAIKTDPVTYLYDMYIYTSDTVHYKRFQPDFSLNSNIISIETSSKPLYLELYGYDRNLANYYGSTNIFIKPNTYRKLFSSVENGYGCFGSLNKKTLVVQ